MTTTHTIQDAITYSTEKRDEFRLAFDLAKPGSKYRREIEEELNFWQGKLAAEEALAEEFATTGRVI